MNLFNFFVISYILFKRFFWITNSYINGCLIIVMTEHFVKQCFEIVSFGIINLTAKESIIG